MRTYNVRLIALALRIPVKWVDNLLSHHSLPGVTGGTRGVERRVTDDGLLAIELCRMLGTELGMPLGHAASIAQHVIVRRSDPRERWSLGSGIVLEFPLEQIEQRLRARLLDAVEAVPHVRRGRPPERPGPLPE